LNCLSGFKNFLQSSELAFIHTYTTCYFVSGAN
jgi:hypothetical protein